MASSYSSETKRTMGYFVFLLLFKYYYIFYYNILKYIKDLKIDLQKYKIFTKHKYFSYTVLLKKLHGNYRVKQLIPKTLVLNSFQ